MSTLSSVVSHLVRASMGSSVSSMVTDEELDRHVAELILKDAKKKAERYGQHGVRAFLANGGMSDSNAPRTNKRFLSSIIRSTDDHNKTILRAQALATQEIKRERAEQERRERRARAEEAVEAERLRRSGMGFRRRRTGEEEEDWDRWDGRTADRKRKSRAWDTWDGEDEDVNIDREKHGRKSWHTFGSRSGEHQTDGKRHSRHSSTRSDGQSTSKKRRPDRRSRSQSPKTHRSSDMKSRRRTRDISTSRLRPRSPLDEDCNDSRNDDYRRSKRYHSRDRHRSPKSRRHSISASPQRRPQSPSASPSEGSNTRKRKRPPLPKYALDDMESEASCSRQLSPLRSTSVHSLANEDREAELRRRLRSVRGSNEHPSGSSKRSRSPSDARSLSQGIDPRTKHCEAASSSSLTLKTRSVSPGVSMSMSRTPTPGPEPAGQLPSKMDKYFEDSYDPRLDVAPLAVPQVPATGLINNADFEDWDAMLELIRVRREDKEEKKRMERRGLTKEKIKDKKKGITEAINIMDIEYKKRGSVREWDLGKEGS